VIPSGHVYVFKKAVLTVKMAALIISRLAKCYCNRSIISMLQPLHVFIAQYFRTRQCEDAADRMQKRGQVNG